MKRLLIVDGNMMMHRGFAAIPALTNPDTQEEVGAVYGVVQMLYKALKDYGPTHAVACFDRPEPTFRKLLFDGYKKDEVPQEPNMHFINQIPRCKQVFEAFGVPRFELAGYEADDLIGTIARQAEAAGFDEVLVMSEDTDMYQLVTQHVKVLRSTGVIDAQAVVQRFGVSPGKIPDFKALCGDASDKIPQVPGIGGMTAMKLLSSGPLEMLLTHEPVGKEAKAWSRVKELETQVILSKKLATIDDCAPVAFDETAAKLDLNARSEVVIKLLEELGFRKLMDAFARVMEEWTKAALQAAQQLREAVSVVQKSMMEEEQ